MRVLPVSKYDFQNVFKSIHEKFKTSMIYNYP